MIYLACSGNAICFHCTNYYITSVNVPESRLFTILKILGNIFSHYITARSHSHSLALTIACFCSGFPHRLHLLDA